MESVEILPQIESSRVSPNLFTIIEAARYLRCSTTTFWRIRTEYDFPVTKVGKRSFFRREELDRYLGLDSDLATLREILQEFSIDRLSLSRLEVDGKVNGFLVGEIIKYKRSEVRAVLEQEVTHG
jgi:excisionase family DNA binding protein